MKNKFKWTTLLFVLYTMAFVSACEQDYITNQSDGSKSPASNKSYLYFEDQQYNQIPKYNIPSEPVQIPGSNFVPATPCVASEEICDGMDNDCDSKIDEDLGTTTCGVGACEQTVQNCVNGEEQTCVPDEPGEEICGDEIDNNCNGAIDETCIENNCGQINGNIWDDENRDGLMDLENEWLLPNVKVRLFFDSDGDGFFETFAGESITDLAGFYYFEGLLFGSYKIRII
jgi:hypothetical protein